MGMTVRNPQNGRLETVGMKFTDENTTWFDTGTGNRETNIITDVEGDLLIREPNYTYPLRIYDMSRTDIGHCQKKVTELKRRYEWESADWLWPHQQVKLRSSYGLPPFHLLITIMEVWIIFLNHP
jgi:hypothetical protein